MPWGSGGADSGNQMRFVFDIHVWHRIRDENNIFAWTNRNYRWDMHGNCWLSSSTCNFVRRLSCLFANGTEIWSCATWTGMDSGLSMSFRIHPKLVLFLFIQTAVNETHSSKWLFPPSSGEEGTNVWHTWPSAIESAVEVNSTIHNHFSIWFFSVRFFALSSLVRMKHMTMVANRIQ